MKLRVDSRHLARRFLLEITVSQAQLAESRADRIYMSLTRVKAKPAQPDSVEYSENLIPMPSGTRRGIIDPR